MKTNPVIAILKFIPMLAFVVILYNILAFFWPASLDAAKEINMASGAVWKFSVNHAFICAAVILLYVEIFKATRTSSVSIVDHALSMAVFVACLVEFIMVSKVGNSTFFIIMLITLLDVVAGFTITISTARRDFGVGAHAAP